MTSAYRSSLVVLALASASCDRAPATRPAPTGVADVTVPVLAGRLAQAKAVPIDANTPGTRKRLGLIPGAIALSSFDEFALTELPSDKQAPLVFYCANAQCTASHVAADKARAAGYAKVEVLSAGIAGWVAAGQPVDKAP